MEDLDLPHLQTLDVYLGPDGFTIFKHLIMPALAELYIEDHSDSPATYIAITHMLSRSVCPLSVFYAKGNIFDPPMEMVELMECMPAARVFKAPWMFLDNLTLDSMIGCGRLLPSLTTLVCNVCIASAFLNALALRLEQAEEGNLKVTTLHSAEGGIQHCHCTHTDLSNVFTILEGLNKKYGTSYSLHWSW